MTRDEIESILRRAVATNQGLPESAVTPAATLEQLGVNSTDAITILFEVEDQLGVTFPTEEYAELSSLDDLVSRFAALVASKDSGGSSSS